jgi:hypothetical protein
MFRFEHKDLIRLLPCLHLTVVRTSSGKVCEPEEALLLLCARLAVPGRWVDHMKLFGGSEGFLSEVFFGILKQIHDRFADRLLNNLGRYSDQFPRWSALVAAKGGAIPNCIGFLDNTKRGICRPKRNQHASYCGYKKKHCLSYQAVISPVGIIFDLNGPHAGFEPDVTCLVDSTLLTRLEDVCTILARLFVLYADRGYPMHELLWVAHRGAAIGEFEAEWNRVMNRERTSVEWGYGKVTSLWSYLDHKQQQKLLLQPVAMHYIVAVILTNCHTCMNGSVTTSWFQTKAPSLESYLGVFTEQESEDMAA